MQKLLYFFCGFFFHVLEKLFHILVLKSNQNNLKNSYSSLKFETKFEKSIHYDAKYEGFIDIKEFLQRREVYV